MLKGDAPVIVRSAERSQAGDALDAGSKTGCKQHEAWLLEAPPVRSVSDGDSKSGYMEIRLDQIQAPRTQNIALIDPSIHS